MKNTFLSLIAIVAALTSAGNLRAEDPLTVAATTGMIADLVKQIGGDRVDVQQLMGPGTDPHSYKPSASDAGKLSRADVTFYNGLMLEGRMADLFTRIGRSGKPVYAVSEAIDEARLLEPDEFEGHFDPHVWFDVSLWAQTVPVIVDGLSKAAPGHAAEFEKRGNELTERLNALHGWCLEQAGTLPEEKRILITSHDAFNYFGKAYGFQVVALQGVSTISEASLADMVSLVDFVKAQNVGAIFVESSVNPAAIQRVSQDSGVEIGGELFSDAMGESGDIRDGLDVGTYEGMIRYNMRTIVEALGK